MSNGYKTEWKSGQHNVVCATCQAYFKSSEVKRQWNGLLTCWHCWDPDPRPKFVTPPTVQEEMRPVPHIQKDEDDQ